MKSLLDYLLEQEYRPNDNSAINEMANLGKKTTKQPFVIYVSDNRGVNHGPRIKVNADYGDRWSGTSFTVTITDDPVVIGNTGKIRERDLDNIKDWVLMNRSALLAYWKQQIDIAELIEQLRTV